MPGASASVTPAVESRNLLQGCTEVLIRHGNEVYRLRHTRNDKLILTK
ncbi:MAG: hemin uptake protein HemP [Thermomonas sp.]